MSVRMRCPICGGVCDFMGTENATTTVMHGCLNGEFRTDWGCGAVLSVRNGKLVPLDATSREFIKQPKVKAEVEAALEQVRAAFWG